MSNEQKLREVLQHAIEDLSSATGFLTRRSRDRQSKTVAALAQLQADIALPTADHIPDAGRMVVDHFPDATKMIETAAPVGDREAFERTMMDKFGWQRNDFKLDDFGYFDGHTDTAWMAWQARAALIAGDAVDAQRTPLTVLQYNAIPELCAIPPSLYESVVRAIERAHGIDAALRAKGGK